MVTVTAMAVIIAIIHFNTVIHPFTLADNRHYVFYVFRILQKHPMVKYLVAPIYYMCALSVLTSLKRLGITRSASKQKVDPPQKASTRTQQTSPDTETDDGDLRASWILIWLSTTTLSLCFAPLVEPRYSILPWMIWRLHLPFSKSLSPTHGSKNTIFRRTIQYLHDHGLLLETLWFLTINGVTGYGFLYRSFEWKQEPGKTQRFLW